MKWMEQQIPEDLNDSIALQQCIHHLKDEYNNFIALKRRKVNANE
jgi:hypothetical protein